MSLPSVFTCRDKSVFLYHMLSLYRICSVWVSRGSGGSAELVGFKVYDYEALEWLAVTSRITQPLCYFAGTNPTVMEVLGTNNIEICIYSF